MDLRGHGRSEKPRDAYDDSALWADDVAAVAEALSQFVERCVYGELSDEEFYRVLGYNVVAPPYVRSGPRDREVYHEGTLRGLDVPVLFTHREEDRIVHVENTEVQMGFVEDARCSVYAGTDHSPFREASDRYDEGLRSFVEEL